MDASLSRSPSPSPSFQDASPLDQIIAEWQSWIGRVQLAFLLQALSAFVAAALPRLAACAAQRHASTSSVRVMAALVASMCILLSAALPMVLFDHEREMATVAAVRRVWCL